MVGSARMINSLYYFEDTLPSNKIAQGLSSIFLFPFVINNGLAVQIRPS